MRSSRFSRICNRTWPICYVPSISTASESTRSRRRFMPAAGEVPITLTSPTFDNAMKKESQMTKATTKPANLRANAMPTDGYVLVVDGKLKTRFDSSEDAMTAGTKLKQSFPVIQVAVLDAAGRISTPVELQKE